MESVCMTAFAFTLLMAVMSLGVKYGLSRSLFGPSSFYWSSWILLTACGVVASLTDILPGQVVEETTVLILQLHTAAFLAFFIHDISVRKEPRRMSFFIHDIPGRKEPRRMSLAGYHRLVADAHLVVSWELFLGLALFAVGAALLIERIMFLGVPSMEFYSATRSLLGEGQASLLGRVGGYVNTFVIPLLCAAFAITDVDHDIKLRRLITLSIYGAPYGIALGFRTFLVLPAVNYVIDLLIARHLFQKQLLPRKDLRVLMSFLMPALLVFSIIGYVRGLPDNSEESFDRSELTQPITYVAVTMTAIAPVSEWVDNIPTEKIVGYQFGLSYLFMLADRLGISDYRMSRDRTDAAVLEDSRRLGLSYLWIPPTTIPFMIVDVGPEFWPLYAFVCLMILAMITKHRPASLVGFLLVCTSVKALVDSTSVMAGFTIASINAMILSYVVVQVCRIYASRKAQRGVCGW